MKEEEVLLEFGSEIFIVVFEVLVELFYGVLLRKGLEMGYLSGEVFRVVGVI